MLTDNVGSQRMTLAHMVVDVALELSAVPYSDSHVDGGFRFVYPLTETLVAVIRGPAAVNGAVHCGLTRSSRRINIMGNHFDYRLRDGVWKRTTGGLAATSELRYSSIHQVCK